MNATGSHANTLTLTALVTVLSLAAQCPFDPTVLWSGQILCPGESTTLSTQPYDSYQWFKDGSAIPGATTQTIGVSAALDAGSSFHVVATNDGCTEASPPVLVDSWVFLLPAVMHGGDTPHGMGLDGELLFCAGDTLLLTLLQPYDTLIQWTDNGFPIAGADQSTLVVTGTGSYSVSGAPSICPNFIQQLGVTISVIRQPPVQPDIVPNGSELCAYPAGNSYQWYFNGQPIAGSDTTCIDASTPGLYTLAVDYGLPCQIPSEGFLATGLPTVEDAFDVGILPVPASQRVRFQWPGTAKGIWSVIDANGRSIAWGQVTEQRVHDQDVSSWPVGHYTLRTVDDRRVTNERFQVAR
ncbi:MAG: hypothetical protein IPK99_05630 [Flavobacteriales bacterium]|nr:hypothetical protein [Flavobacteriales bacterium]